MKGPQIWFNYSICSRLILAMCEGVPYGLSELRERTGGQDSEVKRLIRLYLSNGWITEDHLLTKTGMEIKDLLTKLGKFEQ